MSEILKAQWEDVRLDLRLLIVPLSRSDKPRHIPLSDEAIAVIRAIPRTPGNPWMFPGHAPENRFPTFICSGTNSGGNWPC